MSAPKQPESAEATLIVDDHTRTTSVDQPRGRPARAFARGEAVGRYVILERVGAGGMGVVYAAWDPKLDRKVALKLLHGDNADHGQRLEREAQAMARLTHPNVIAVHDVGEVEGRVFVAMEFVEGETLTRWARLERGEARPEAAEPREWSAILEVMLAAGRGLAAAHAEGLIHRDFKPDNVMIGGDGRVRVMDFGLVRAAVGEAAAPSEAALRRTQQAGALEQLAIESSSVLDSEITHAGALLGTPAYMAPEQLRGDEADARADQFSFCVALWQCLYGVRPFAGDSPLAVLFAISHAKFHEPPPGRTVPSWVRRALERGLASDPAARWPDMQRLLAALSDDPKAKRRPWLLGVASLAVAVAAGAAALALEQPAPPAPCARAGEELRALWTPERRAELEGRFGASELVYAGETWDRVGPRLDAWAEGWVAARRTACEDTQVRQQQSAELLDLRMACLDERRDRFAALVELLAAADATVIEKAVEAVDALPELEICSDRNWLTASVRPPEQPELAAGVAQLRSELARVNTLIVAGKAAEAVEPATRLDARAAELGWTPAIAEAALALGLARQESGKFDEARPALERAYFSARRSGHDEVTVRAGIYLIYTLSLGLGEFELAAGWIDHTLAEAERIGRDDLLAEVHSAIGIHHYVRGEIDPASKALARSLALHRSSESAGVGDAHVNYGTILARADPNNAAVAFAALELGMRTLEASYGPHHPHFAAALSNYATVLGQLGRHREAIALLERALKIAQPALGATHPTVGRLQLNLATNFMGLSREGDEAASERALEFAERSLATHEAAFGDGHSMVAQSQRSIASALLELERIDEAITHADRAIELWAANFGEAHPDTLASQLVRARCDIRRGRTTEALARVEGIFRHEIRDAPELEADASLMLAELIADDDRRRARKLLDRAKPYYEATNDVYRLKRIAAVAQKLEPEPDSARR